MSTEVKAAEDRNFRVASDVDQILNARPEPERKEPETVGEPMFPDEDV